MFLLEIMVFNFQYLSSFWNEIAADTLYETFTSSQHKAWKFTSPAVFHKDLRNFLRKYRARLGLGFTYNRQLWNSGASMVFKKGMFLERKGDFGKATSSGKSCSTQLCMKLAQEVFIRKTYWLCVCDTAEIHPHVQGEMEIWLQRQRPQPQEVLWEVILQREKKWKREYLSRSKGFIKKA